MLIATLKPLKHKYVDNLAADYEHANDPWLSLSLALALGWSLYALKVGTGEYDATRRTSGEDGLMPGAPPGRRRCLWRCLLLSHPPIIGPHSQVSRLRSAWRRLRRRRPAGGVEGVVVVSLSLSLESTPLPRPGTPRQ